MMWTVCWCEIKDGKTVDHWDRFRDIENLIKYLEENNLFDSEDVIIFDPLTEYLLPSDVEEVAKDVAEIVKRVNAENVQIK